MPLPLQSLAWARALALLDAARSLTPTLSSPRARVRALATRLLRFAQDDIEAEGESTDPSIWTPAIAWSCDVVAIDLETTGLDASTDLITEIGAVRCDRHFRIREMIHVCVRVPEDTPKSDWLSVHTAWGKAHPRAWNSHARPLAEALATVGALLEDAAPMAHHLPFEQKFLLAAYEKVGEPSPPGCEWVRSPDWLRGSIDTRELAAPLKARGLVMSDSEHPTRSLEPVCRALGIPHDPHNALSDALASLELAKIILSGEV